MCIESTLSFVVFHYLYMIGEDDHRVDGHFRAIHDFFAEFTLNFDTLFVSKKYGDIFDGSTQRP